MSNEITMPYNVKDLVTLYDYLGSGYFFSKETMNFFKSRLQDSFARLNDKECLFMTSEKRCFDDESRVYTVRKATLVPKNESSLEGRLKIKIDSIGEVMKLNKYLASKLLKDTAKAFGDREIVE